MNTLEPLIELLDAADYDGVKIYMDHLHEVSSTHNWIDFTGMPGRIHLIRSSLRKDVRIPSEPFRRGATDNGLRNQILLAYRIEAKNLLKSCATSQRPFAIDRAGSVLIKLAELMSEVLPESMRGAAQAQMIEATYKNSVFPREIALQSDALEPYLSLVLELDLGL